MKFDVYFVDAFTSDIFSGNPAAVIFSDLDDELLMQKIAAENNLSETAFIDLSKKKLLERSIRYLKIILDGFLQPVR